MRLLLLDDDKAHGALLASASKKLGHHATVVSTEAEALDHLTKSQVDAVLIRVQLQETTGPSFVDLLTSMGVSLPLAFITGTCQDMDLIEEASSRGDVLRKVWTRADLKKILDAIEAQVVEVVAKRLEEDGTIEFAEDTEAEIEIVMPTPTAAEFRSRALTWDNDDDSGSFDVATIDVELHASHEVWQAQNKLRIACASWDAVQKLCREVQAGQSTVTINTTIDMKTGEDATVSVVLPDETTIALSARVVGSSPIADSKTSYRLDLLGFGDDVMDFLLRQCDANLEKNVTPIAIAGPVDEIRITWGKPSG